MRIAIQGQAGSFHHQAARQWYGENCDIIPCTTFAEVFSIYEKSEADAVVCAVENTIYGSINEVYQLIEDCSAPIIGEVVLAIEQQLIASAQTKLTDITEVYSHPVALAQCREWLSTHLPNAQVIEYFDTAAAAEYVTSLGEPHVAAIAGVEAARLYDVPILAKNIHDHPHNQTRFVILEVKETDQKANRAALVVTTHHRPGALVEVLNIFANAGVNLEKLQSQPVVGSPWQYKFYIVVDTAGEKLRALASEIEQRDHSVILLGEYVAHPIS